MSDLNYQFVCPDGKSGRVTRKLKSDTEYLVAYYYSTIDSGPEIVISGNPLGLRKLAEQLLELANVDQSSLDIPDTALEHYHIHTGRNTEEVDSLPRLTLLRADTKNDPNVIDGSFPPHVPRLGKHSI